MFYAPTLKKHLHYDKKMCKAMVFIWSWQKLNVDNLHLNISECCLDGLAKFR